MNVVAQRLGFPASWRELSLNHLGAGVTLSMGLVRFYLMTLKATALLCIRCGQIEEGLAMLEKLTELDTRDRIGGRALLDVARSARTRVRAQA
jgi:DNA-binding SARP family transcriptional activator